MFAIVLKNSILMILIILIIHFMIINYINDLKQERYVQMNKMVHHYLDDEQQTITNSNNNTNQAPSQKTIKNNVNDPSVEKPTSDEEEMLDLYNFVYDDKTTDDSLNNFFPELKNADTILKGCDVMCSEQPVDSKSKLFCLNEVDQFIHENKKNMIDTKEKTTSSHNTLNNKFTENGKHPILFEYVEDVDNKLLGFESYESSYMTL